jgi:acyl-CoA synthetase (AMP-forming)/AMP-acid ligase II
VPLPPPDAARLKRTMPRLQAIIQNAQAKFVLTTGRVKAMVESLGDELTGLEHLQWIATEDIGLAAAQQWQAPAIDRNTLAYLQYTSGSTALPKGVMISHGNLLHNAAHLNCAFQYDDESVSVTWLPYFHDYGLVDGLISPLYTGIPCYVMSPLSFIKRPFRWLQAISKYRATHSGGPNFAYDYCVRQITEAQRSTLDLSHWKVGSCGAEPIRPDTLSTFMETFRPYGLSDTTLYPGYGLAEATLMVSSPTSSAKGLVFRRFLASALSQGQALVLESNLCDPVDAAVGRVITGCGRTLGDCKVVIANPDTCTQCEAQEVGEIWVSGQSVALGYWDHPIATEQTFRAYLADTQEGPFLRTGDLGFLIDGQLFVTGRLKDLIIIGGANHFPQDIELTVEKSHPLIKPTCSAAFSVDCNNEEKLVVIAEIDHRQRLLSEMNALDASVQAIRQQVAEIHELKLHAIVLIKSGSIPKTSSGKIQRSACRQAFLSNSLETVGEWLDGQQVLPPMDERSDNQMLTSVC